MERLIEEGKVGGVVQGKGPKATYVPAVYSAARKEYVESFMEHNSFVGAS